MGERCVLAAKTLAGLLLLLGAVAVQAQERPYSSDDVLMAIDEASAETGVSAAYLTRIIRCEDPDLDPYAIGRQGELGPVQPHPHGELLRFYAWQYTDPFSPYQAVRFLAQRITMGGVSAWSCA